MAADRSYDAIVLGLGGFGSAALYHLARRGQRVLGLDAHARGHAEGSSHGRSRITRQVYQEGAAYVPLVRRSYDLWRELETMSGAPLLQLGGGLYVGPPDHPMIVGALASARQHRLPHELLAPGAVPGRGWPWYRVPTGRRGRLVVRPDRHRAANGARPGVK